LILTDSIIIVDEIGKVAAATNTALAAKNFPHSVYYMYGHPKEVNQRLQEMTDSPTEGNKKFPLIWLFTDIMIERNLVGLYGQTKLRFLIANYTEGHYRADQRTSLNFIPVLHPIKEEFINQLFLHKQFTNENEVEFAETDMYYYGSQLNDKNVLNDRIDAIELRNVKLTIKLPIC